MMRRKQGKYSRELRQIAFDLCIESLKEHYPRPKNSSDEQYYNRAYYDIKRFMKKQGFKHQQGSVYNSTQKLTRAEIHSILKEMVKEMPWLYKCVSKMDLTIIQGPEQDLVGFIKKESLRQTKNIARLEVGEEARSDINKTRSLPTLQELINITVEKQVADSFSSGVKAENVISRHEEFLL